MSLPHRVYECYIDSFTEKDDIIFNLNRIFSFLAYIVLNNLRLDLTRFMLKTYYIRKIEFKTFDFKDRPIKLNMPQYESLCLFSRVIDLGTYMYLSKVNKN